MLGKIFSHPFYHKIIISALQHLLNGKLINVCWVVTLARYIMPDKQATCAVPCMSLRHTYFHYPFSSRLWDFLGPSLLQRFGEPVICSAPCYLLLWQLIKRGSCGEFMSRQRNATRKWAGLRILLPVTALDQMVGASVSSVPEISMNYHVSPWQPSYTFLLSIRTIYSPRNISRNRWSTE